MILIGIYMFISSPRFNSLVRELKIKIIQDLSLNSECDFVITCAIVYVVDYLVNILKMIVYSYYQKIFIIMMILRLYRIYH